MELLKVSRNRTGKNKHIGGEIPPVLYSTLCLYATAKGISKSAIIRNALQTWADQVEEETRLINILSDRVKQLWCAKKGTMEYDAFLKLIEGDLKETDINSLTITKILERVKK